MFRRYPTCHTNVRQVHASARGKTHFPFHGTQTGVSSGVHVYGIRALDDEPLHENETGPYYESKKQAVILKPAS